MYAQNNSPDEILGKWPLALQSPGFSGWALCPHTACASPNTHSATQIRSALGQLSYRYRYGGEDDLRYRLAGILADAIQRLFIDRGTSLDSLVAVPPLAHLPEYPRVVALVSELARQTALVSLQFTVRKHAIQPPADSSPLALKGKFGLSSAQAAQFLQGKKILVIDDIYRTGRSLHEFCGLLRNSGGAADVAVLVLTAL